MVSKDQTIGGVIFIVCIIVAVFYVLILFCPQLFWNIEYMLHPQFWVIAVPVFIAFIAVMGIGAWIGWTMATTPPPKPIEEITSEMEEKKEEEKAPEEAEEKEKPERKKKREK